MIITNIYLNRSFYEGKKYIKVSVFLMILSAIMIFTAIVYYDLADKVKDYKYSDKEEYDDITKGLNFLSKFPIHFNIINKYFSDFNNLSQKEKEEVVMGYVIKNKYKLYECGPSNNSIKHLCIDKDVLNSKELLNIFNLDMKFESENINVYIDDYGTYSVTTTNDSKYYKIVLDNTNNKLYRLYSSFSHYKKENDKHIFYMYQGYYMGNCVKDEKLDLYDFMSGKIVYTNKCNDNQKFNIENEDDIKKLQLYKYELKKDSDNNFYISGYNPVKSYQ